MEHTGQVQYKNDMNTHRSESSDLRLLIIRCRIVHRHPAAGALEEQVLHQRHPMVRPVAMVEEEHGGPVVRKVLGEGACCACCLLRDVPRRVHERCEGVAAYNLVEMWGGRLAR